MPKLSLRSIAALALVASTTACSHPDGARKEAARRLDALASTYDWLQFYGDVRRTGNNTLESRISAANVGGLKQLWRASLPATGDGAPAVLTAVQTPTGGLRDLVYVTTKQGQLVALDAHTGANVWTAQPATASQITSSSAAVDPSRAWVYSYGVDGYVHRFDVGSGVESTGNGFPELVTLKPTIEKGSSAIAIASANGTRYLYMATSAFIGDGGTYQGHLTTIDLATGAQKVFNAACSDRTIHFSNGGANDCTTIRSALWPRVGVVYDADANRILTATGNGSYNPGNHSWGDSILALSADGAGTNGGPLDSYTPTNFQNLENADLDLGSTAPALLPSKSAKYPRLALQSGKDQQLRIVNLDNLSGQGGPGHVGGELFAMALPQGGEVQNAVPVWTNPADGSVWAFVAAPKNGLAAFKLGFDANGNPNLTTMWQLLVGGGSPLIANGVLYYATTNKIYALSPTTGAQLWSDGTIGKIHWESPVVANGVLYILDESAQLTAYSLDPLPVLPRDGWIATASLTQQGSAPGNAIDGSTTTRWTTGIVEAPDQWFQLDLGSVQTFNSLVVLAGGGGDYAAGYRLQLSPDGNDWSSAPIASGAAHSQTWSILFPTVSARYLRITLTAASSSWWSIADVSLYDSTPAGTGGPGPDMAMAPPDMTTRDFAVTPPPPPPGGPLPRTGWTVASLPASASANLAIDGDASTRWSSGAAQAAGQAFIVDMQTVQSFAEITLDAAGSTNDYPRGYEVYVSNDGAAWGTSIASGSGTGALTTIRFAPQTARYFKIVQTGTTTWWWSIHELNAYAQAELDPSTWSATASSSGANDAPAQAFDGNPNSRWSTGAAQANGQFFRLDLGVAHTVSRLVLDATGSNGDYPRGYQVYTSLDGASFGAPVASGAGGAQSLTIGFAPVNARYLKIVQTGSAPNWWSIGELTVQ